MIQSLADRELWREQGSEAIELAARPRERVCLLLGAGASAPLLPTAAKLKAEILATVLGDRLRREFDLGELKELAARSHITLEVFCSMLRYRCGRRFDVLRMWSEICRGVGVNSLAASIAALRRRGWCGAILTTNFDCVIQEALSDQPFRMLTELQLRSETEPEEEDVCALHGTTFEQPANGPGTPPFAAPLSATARGLARPYSPSLYRYLSRFFACHKLLVIGHSGRDYYDLNRMLAELKARQSALLEKWLWISYPGGNDEEVLRLGQLVGPQNVLQADATKVLLKVCVGLGLPRRSEGSSQGAKTDEWRERLRAAIAAFELAPDDVRDFLLDLRRNLPGAWVVQEHYRLYSAGYGEGDTLTFGGVAQGGALEASERELPDLDFLQRPFQIPFGDLLRGQFAYRSDDQRYAGREDPAPEHDYAKAVTVFERMAQRIDLVLDTAPAGSLRAEDRALAWVGKAIAIDYLGLIHRKRWQFLGGEELRREALSCFRRCIELAGQARAALAPLLAAALCDPDRQQALEDLVQWWVWELIGKDNVARTLPGPEAAGAFREAIAARQRLIELERKRGRREKAVSTMNDYLIAHYPQLWLRASELVKSLLHAESDTAVPLRWNEISEESQAGVKANLRLCQDAYDRFDKLTVGVHRHYPAPFEARIIVYAARGFAARTARARAAARGKIEEVYARFQGIATQFPAVSRTWVQNVGERVAAIREKMESA
jgi:hypothetical protein